MGKSWALIRAVAACHRSLALVPNELRKRLPSLDSAALSDLILISRWSFWPSSNDQKGIWFLFLIHFETNLAQSTKTALKQTHNQIYFSQLCRLQSEIKVLADIVSEGLPVGIYYILTCPQMVSRHQFPLLKASYNHFSKNFRRDPNINSTAKYTHTLSVLGLCCQGSSPIQTEIFWHNPPSSLCGPTVGIVLFCFIQYLMFNRRMN